MADKNKTPAKGSKRGSEVKQALTRKLGPLPVWGWAAIAAAALWYYRARQAAAQADQGVAQTGTPTYTGPYGGGDQFPGFGDGGGGPGSGGGGSTPPEGTGGGAGGGTAGPGTAPPTPPGPSGPSGPRGNPPPTTHAPPPHGPKTPAGPKGPRGPSSPGSGPGGKHRPRPPALASQIHQNTRTSPGFGGPKRGPATIQHKVDRPKAQATFKSTPNRPRKGTGNKPASKPPAKAPAPKHGGKKW